MVTGADSPPTEREEQVFGDSGYKVACRQAIALGISLAGGILQMMGLETCWLRQDAGHGME